VLTSDLLVARVRRGKVMCGYLPVEGEDAERFRQRVRALIDTFHEHVGRTRGELRDALEETTRGRPDFRLDRGLAKLLEDRSRFLGIESEAAATLRLELFTRAASARRETGTVEREDLLDGLLADPGPEALGLPAGSERTELDAALYGDLKLNQVLIEIKAIEPEALIDRYNLALAQAVLLRAHHLRVEVRAAEPARLRQLLRHVKFQGLLTLAARQPDGRVLLELDGPLSLFGNTARYGVKMAGFLPALLLCEDWSLEAVVALGRSRTQRTFQLTPAQGLVTHARDAGAWLPELIEAFSGRFAELESEWSVDLQVPLLNLGGEVIVPDFRFVHVSGFEASMEVLGYWRRGGVARRLEALSEHGAPNLVVAVDHKLKLGDEGVKGLEGPVVPYREVPNGRTVLRVLERLRKAAGGGFKGAEGTSRKKRKGAKARRRKGAKARRGS
jgi:predicted nuclease of restriction endonuclease-like RecB superfamily